MAKRLHKRSTHVCLPKYIGTMCDSVQAVVTENNIIKIPARSKIEVKLKTYWCFRLFEKPETPVGMVLDKLIEAEVKAD